ncbi:MAG: bile acid:sodium symporter family protein [Bacteroidia bacterium]|nr:bile acid:sodium symporter family protein [Bacteroidia bacterium]
MCEEFDAVQLAFSAGSLDILNITLCVIMFGVALNLNKEDFVRIVREPKSAFTGLVSQFFLLPLLTLGLVWVLKPCPSMALGMFLVASCPGGNLSNFISLLAKGNVALSVSLSAVSTLLSIVMTPFNFTFWSQWYPPAAEEMQRIAMDPWQILTTVLLILGLPLFLGMFFSHRFPAMAAKVNKPIRVLSLLFFAGYILGALIANWDAFMLYISAVILLVALHNGVALLGGYFFAWVMGLGIRERRTISIETGIQNSGVALVLIFGPIFAGRGGMAIIAALWGIWHLVAGISLATFWSRRKISTAVETAP